VDFHHLGGRKGREWGSTRTFFCRREKPPRRGTIYHTKKKKKTHRGGEETNTYEGGKEKRGQPTRNQRRLKSRDCGKERTGPLHLDEAPQGTGPWYTRSRVLKQVTEKKEKEKEKISIGWPQSPKLKKPRGNGATVGYPEKCEPGPPKIAKTFSPDPLVKENGEKRHIKFISKSLKNDVDDLLTEGRGKKPAGKKKSTSRNLFGIKGSDRCCALRRRVRAWTQGAKPSRVIVRVHQVRGKSKRRQERARLRERRKKSGGEWRGDDRGILEL